MTLSKKKKNHQTHLDTTGGLFRAAEPSSTPEATLPLKAGHQANDIKKKKDIEMSNLSFIGTTIKR